MLTVLTQESIASEQDPIKKLFITHLDALSNNTNRRITEICKSIQHDNNEYTESLKNNTEITYQVLATTGEPCEVTKKARDILLDECTKSEREHPNVYAGLIKQAESYLKSMDEMCNTSRMLDETLEQKLQRNQIHENNAKKIEELIKNNWQISLSNLVNRVTITYSTVLKDGRVEENTKKAKRYLLDECEKIEQEFPDIYTELVYDARKYLKMLYTTYSKLF